MPSRVLVLFAHPAPHKSRINRHLIASVQGLDNVTINDLYEEYPTFDINVQREQELLLAHDIIVFQHPFYWYSSPAILKEWRIWCSSMALPMERAAQNFAESFS